MQTIASNYFFGYFIFDFLSTAPGLYSFQDSKFYLLKYLRVVHINRITSPLQFIMDYLLKSYSKKRQNDITSFSKLILYVIYSSHFNACIWLYLGKQRDCQNVDLSLEEPCKTSSWTYVGSPGTRFADKPIYSQYIFAFYWIFEVITTVGYGDYFGSTSEEYLFSICLQFIGLVFFSFLMGSINNIFNTSDNFEDLIDEKLDSLDMWIKKIEKSNKPFHIQPYLYNDIKNYIN